MKENQIPKNIENNNLSLVEDINSQDKIESNNIMKNHEIIPIKPLKNANTIKSAEEYFSLIYPEYKLFKCYGILFCKIGNLITFNFNKNNNFIPKFSIGPHWYMTIILNLIITSLGSTLFIFIIKKLNFLFHIVFFIFYLIVIFCVNRTALLNPEIALNKLSNIDNYCFCNKCKIYYNPNEKVQHCDFCKVCIKNLDHHCVWIGKCVGKNNLASFYGMVFSVGLLYIFIIICLIIYNMKKKD